MPKCLLSTHCGHSCLVNNWVIDVGSEPQITGIVCEIRNHDPCIRTQCKGLLHWQQWRSPVARPRARASARWKLQQPTIAFSPPGPSRPASPRAWFGERNCAGTARTIGLCETMPGLRKCVGILSTSHTAVPSPNCMPPSLPAPRKTRCRPARGRCPLSTRCGHWASRPSCYRRFRTIHTAAIPKHSNAASAIGPI